MKKFNIGDKVIALDSSQEEGQQKRVKGQQYIVCDIIYCAKCGMQAINLGEKLNAGWSDKYLCTCGARNDNFGLWWSKSDRFAPIDDIENIMEEAIANEDYELCSLLIKNK